MTTPDETPQGFASAWDVYVDKARQAGQEWPGDDWGDTAQWDAWFERLFAPTGVATWSRAVEIGQGTGKYTSRVLQAGSAEVLACDVSQKFLDLCRARLATFVDDGRLHTRRIAETDPTGLRSAIEAQGWRGHVDALFSLDTLVHVPFTVIACYLLQATECLRPDGHVILSFAHGLTGPGRQKLLQDIPRVMRGGGDPTTGCFHWITPDLISQTAEAMGYTVDRCDVDTAHHRDGHFVARFTDPARAAEARTVAGLDAT